MKAQRFLLVTQRFHSLPWRNLLEPANRVRTIAFRVVLRHRRFKHSKECLLPTRTITRKRLPCRKRAFQTRNHCGSLFASMQRVETSSFHKSFKTAPPNRARINAFAEIKDALERPALAAFFDDRANRVAGCAFDRLHAEANVPRMRGRPFVGCKHHREILFAQVHIRRTHLNADVAFLCGIIGVFQASTIIEIHRPLFDLARLAFKTQHRSHVMRGEICLQVRSLIRNDRVARRVTLIKSVARKLQDEFEEFSGFVVGETTLSRALHKRCTRAVDDILLLLRDRFDDRVRLTQRNATEMVQHLHDLLLIHHDAVGFRRETLDNLMQLRHQLSPIFAGVVVRNEIHRTRTEQRVGGDEIFQSIRLHIDEQSLHAA